MAKQECDRKHMETRVPYKDFGLTEEEYAHGYNRFLGRTYKSPECTCRGCYSPIHIDEGISEEGSWCRVLYLDGDEGVALFTREWELPCYNGQGFSMSILDCAYCEIPYSHMKKIMEIFQEHQSLVDAMPVPTLQVQ
jgi:hypothetical protein